MKRQFCLLFLIFFSATYHCKCQWYVQYNDSLLAEKERFIEYNSTHGKMYTDTIYNKLYLNRDEKFYKLIKKILRENKFNAITQFYNKHKRTMDFGYRDLDSNKKIIRLDFGLNFSRGRIYAIFSEREVSYGIKIECQATYISKENKWYSFRSINVHFIKNYLLKWLDILEPLLIDSNSTWGMKSPSFDSLKKLYEGPPKIMYSK